MDERFSGYPRAGRREVQLSRWLGVAGEVAWTRVPDALGNGGASQAFGETDLGGTSFRVKISVGRYEPARSPPGAGSGAAHPAGARHHLRRRRAAGGAPRAARAVGNILRDARLPGLPYHRVIAAGGQLGGYGNLALKRSLLAGRGPKSRDAVLDSPACTGRVRAASPRFAGRLKNGLTEAEPVYRQCG